MRFSVWGMFAQLRESLGREITITKVNKRSQAQKIQLYENTLLCVDVDGQKQEGVGRYRVDGSTVFSHA